VSENTRWIKVADYITDIPFNDNNLAEVVADGKRICLARHQEEVFAFAAKCPHASGQLAHGFIDALGNVVCPLHRYKFCMKNGRNVTGEGYYLKHWPVKVEAEGVFVGLDQKSLLGLF
jgi:nitrite reductase/ring-hydroxylating ferredoxin subunit